VTYDGIGLPDPSEWNWRLEVTSNDPLNDPGAGGEAIDIVLNVFVADEWHTCTEDTISTGLHRLAVSSCLKLGNQGSGGGLYNYASGRAWLYAASPVLVWLDGSTKRVYRDLYWASMADRSSAANQAFRAQSAITITRDTLITVLDSVYSADVARGSASSTDSLYDLDWEVVTIKKDPYDHGAIMKYTVTNRTTVTYSGLSLGAVADLDVDSSTQVNFPDCSSIEQSVGAAGGYRDATGVPVAQENYAELFFIGLDDSCRAGGGDVLDNVDYVYLEDAFNTDSLYDVVNGISGWCDSTRTADSATDVSVVLVNRQNATLGPDDTLRFAFGLAVSDSDGPDLYQVISQLRWAAGSDCVDACAIDIPGDVNVSGSVTSSDIIKLVGYVFKGAAPPEPCAANGDVNCDGSVTAADIIYLVNFVFKGGMPPCDICNQSPMSCVLNP
jgi:hypothetical protein